jgi:2-polyprenyl-6-methoxyphenol hydroxylase-like FAD-dependent oxidoreductase
VLAPQLATLAERAGQPILQAIYDLESPRIVFGRAVLLGDAAFVARPHVGTGVTKAALDAEALVDTLTTVGGDLGAALARYDCERRQFGNWLVERGRYLGAHLEGHVRDHAQSRPPIETFLREYGAAGVINGETISTRSA